MLAVTCASKPLRDVQMSHESHRVDFVNVQTSVCKVYNSLLHF